MTALPDFAISVRQPWAWAIIHGGKDIENRVKRAITLGRMDQHEALAIHASSCMTRDEYEDARDFMATIDVQCPRPDKLIRGGIIGRVKVNGITRQTDNPWFFGPWALVVSDPVACEPIPCTGQLGSFDWQKGLSDELREPLPWMQAWPERATSRRADRPVVTTMTLFGDVSQ